MKMYVLLTITVVFLQLTACKNNESEPRNNKDTLRLPSTDATQSVPIAHSTDTNTVDTSDEMLSKPTLSATTKVDKNNKVYVNDEGDTISAIYQEAGGMGVVELTLKDKTLKLMKSGVENGTATYTNGKVTWSVKRAEASLKQSNKTTTYKESN